MSDKSKVFPHRLSLTEKCGFWSERVRPNWLIRVAVDIHLHLHDHQKVLIIACFRPYCVVAKIASLNCQSFDLLGFISIWPINFIYSRFGLYQTQSRKNASPVHTINGLINANKYDITEIVDFIASVVLVVMICEAIRPEVNARTHTHPHIYIYIYIQTHCKSNMN